MSWRRTVEWADWGPNWRAIGGVHEALGREAERTGRVVSAAAAYQRAAWCYHLGKFLWFEDPALHAALRDRAVAVYGRTLAAPRPARGTPRDPLRGSHHPGTSAPSESGRRLRRSCSSSPVLIRRRRRCSRIEDEFLRRGMATLSIDGPGQSENSVAFRDPPQLGDGDHAGARPPRGDRVSTAQFGLIGLMGISMGAIYGPRAAAHEPRLAAVVGLAGPYNLGECWDALNPLTRGGYVFYTKSASEEEATREGVHAEPRGRARAGDAAAAGHPRCARPALPARAGGAHRARGAERHPRSCIPTAITCATTSPTSTGR